MSEPTASAGEGERRALAIRLMGMATQFWVPQALYVAAILGIAERLADGPRSSEDRPGRSQPILTGCAACCER